MENYHEVYIILTYANIEYLIEDFIQTLKTEGEKMSQEEIESNFILFFLLKLKSLYGSIVRRYRS